MQTVPVSDSTRQPPHPPAHRAGGQRRSQLSPAACADSDRPALAGARGRGRRPGLGRSRIRAAGGDDRRLLAARSGPGRVSQRLSRIAFPQVDLVAAGGALGAGESARTLSPGTALCPAPLPGHRHGGLEYGAGARASRAPVRTQTMPCTSLRGHSRPSLPMRPQYCRAECRALVRCQAAAVQPIPDPVSTDQTPPSGSDAGMPASGCRS